MTRKLTIIIINFIDHYPDHIAIIGIHHIPSRLKRKALMPQRLALLWGIRTHMAADAAAVAAGAVVAPMRILTVMQVVYLLLLMVLMMLQLVVIPLLLSWLALVPLALAWLRAGCWSLAAGWLPAG